MKTPPAPRWKRSSRRTCKPLFCADPYGRPPFGARDIRKTKVLQKLRSTAKPLQSGGCKAEGRGTPAWNARPDNAADAALQAAFCGFVFFMEPRSSRLAAFLYPGAFAHSAAPREPNPNQKDARGDSYDHNPGQRRFGRRGHRPAVLLPARAGRPAPAIPWKIPTPSGTASRARRPAPSSSWASWPKRPAPKRATTPPCCLRPTR